MAEKVSFSPETGKYVGVAPKVLDNLLEVYLNLANLQGVELRKILFRGGFHAFGDFHT
jgi:hypothetical protein